MKILIFLVLSVPCLMFPGVIFHAEAATHPLPLTLDFNMMEALIKANYFYEPDDKAVVVDGEDGCTFVVLSNPQFSQDDGKLVFETRVQVKVGKKAFGRCISPIRWQGYLILTQKPVLNPDSWSLSFEIVDVKMLSKKRKPLKITNLIWKLVEEDVTGYLSDIRIDLSLPVRNLEDFLLPLFSNLETDGASQFVLRIHPGSIAILPDALWLENTVEIQDEWLAVPMEVEETALSGEEVDAFISAWEEWDSFLIKILLSLSDQFLTDEERQQLLDTVLYLRYAFTEELRRPVMQKDFVRRQFVEAWTSIQNIFRQNLPGQKSDALFGRFAFFSAADALVTLDAAEPGLGFEISNESFNRMARMLITEEIPVPVSPERQNPLLRQLFGLPSWDEEPATPDNAIPNSAYASYFRKLSSLILPVGTAFASGNDPQPTTVEGLPREELAQWVYDRSDLDSYSGKMRGLLGPIAESTLQQSMLPDQYRPMFQRLALATAWQESCFRQFFFGKDGDVIYLSSYTGSSVGLMQINQRVWKGIYDLDSLRWKIEYNARAGCEILDTYFNRYALRYLKKMTPPPDLTEEQLSGAVYAMYNGGPKEFHKFLSRFGSNTLYQSDELFKEKYSWTSQSAWGRLSDCLN